jgi:hypothetical protein
MQGREGVASYSWLGDLGPEPSQKWTYVQKVTVDDVPGLVASGFYPESRADQSLLVADEQMIIDANGATIKFEF